LGYERNSTTPCIVFVVGTVRTGLKEASVLRGDAPTPGNADGKL
jgi:hypothetical protein